MQGVRIAGPYARDRAFAARQGASAQATGVYDQSKGGAGLTYILATSRYNFEFRTADAITELGGFAVVPRRVEITKRKDGTTGYDYHPFIPNFIFAAMTEEQWFSATRKRIFHAGKILPPIRRQLDILPRTWSDFQDFADRAERACDHRIEQHEAGLKVARYRKNDVLRIIGSDLLDGQLKDQFAKFIRLDQNGRIEAHVDGVLMMGKPVVVTLDPGSVMAAE